MIVCASQLFTSEDDLTSAKTALYFYLGIHQISSTALDSDAHAPKVSYTETIFWYLWNCFALIAMSSGFISFEQPYCMWLCPSTVGNWKPLDFPLGDNSFFQSFIIISALHSHLKLTIILNRLHYNIYKYVIFNRHAIHFCFLYSSCRSHISSGP